MTRRWIILFTTIAMLAVVASAEAAQPQWQIDRASAIARIVWHNSCVDEMTIAWGALENGEDAIGETGEGCSMMISGDEPLEWEEFCTVVLHEAGHLAGMGHTERGIMRPVSDFTVTRERNASTGKSTTVVLGADRRCRTRGRPFLRSHRKL